uniref:Pentatricopeptide repeat-containing protein n=1 Tax=Arundo donax TaxID=35708 RepID=A0A0A9FLS7_ARUDO
MRTQPEMRLRSGDHAMHIDLVAKVWGLASAEKFFEDMPECAKAPSTCNALLHTYTQIKTFAHVSDAACSSELFRSISLDFSHETSSCFSRLVCKHVAPAAFPFRTAPLRTPASKILDDPSSV